MTWWVDNWQWSFAQFVTKSANNLVRINFLFVFNETSFRPIMLASSYAFDIGALTQEFVLEVMPKYRQPEFELPSLSGTFRSL